MFFIHSLDEDILRKARQLCASAGMHERSWGSRGSLFASDMAILQRLEDGGYALAKGDFTTTTQMSSAKRLAFDFAGTAQVDSTPLPGAYAIIHADFANRRVTVSCDALATFPLFHFQDDVRLIITDRLSLMNDILAIGFDPAGFMEFMRYGYFVGSRSPIRNVLRLRAGETAFFSPGRPSDSCSVRQQIHWRGEAPDNPSNHNQLVDDLTHMLMEATAFPDGIMLMMSGGWDSRTILAAALAHGTKDLLLYSHGGGASREAAIVSRISQDFGLNLRQVRLSKEIFRTESLREYSLRCDSLLFPHWHIAGSFAEKEGRPCVTSGVLGEVLGGHYGPPMLMTGLPKVKSVGLYLTAPHCAARFYSKESQGLQAVSDRLKEPRYEHPWYLDQGVWSEHFQESSIRVQEDIDAEVAFYRENGITSPSTLLESYVTTQRGAQYICAQQLSCRRPGVSIAMPFANTRFMKQASLVPFEHKIHNKLNQKIIARLEPRLLNYPMAATLVSAKRPIPLQEASRFARRIREELLWRGHKVAPSIISAPSLGWANFQFLDTASLLELVEFLRLDVFDKERMVFTIRATEHQAKHPIWDMLGKMATLDRMIGGSHPVA